MNKKHLKILSVFIILVFFALGLNGFEGCGGCRDNIKPQVFITEPANDSTVSGIVMIKATATDNVSIAKVEFYIDNVKVGEDATSPYEYEWDTNNLQYGSTHTIQAKAYDNTGNIGESPIVTVIIGDELAPQVIIIYPTNGATVSGTITIQASAIDRSKKKAPSGIQKVEFYVDDNKKGEDAIQPYEYNWDTTQENDGPHTITVKAIDLANNIGSASISVVVNNTYSIKKWNFLVYMAADNNLEEYGIKDLNEMEKIGSTDDVNIIVRIDRIPGYDSSNDEWTTTRLYYVTQDSDPNTINSILLADLGELDMSNPDTLRDFVIYCQENFPADKTCLTLWNHGGGVWPRSYKKDKKTFKPSSYIRGGARGLCWDDTTSGYPWNCLTTDEVAQALSQARARTGKKIDVINMDVCLCQMLEIAYEWRNEANFLVGSEETVPGDGNDYTTVLTHLTRDPNMSAQDLAKTLVDDYYSYYNALGYSTTYSYIDLGAPFMNLIDRFKDFAAALYNTDDLDAVYNAWQNATFFSWYENLDLYDLADDLTRLSSDSNVKNTATALKTAISNAVYYKNTGVFADPDEDFPAYGIAIMLPTAYEWVYYSGSNQYVTLALSQDTFWDEFILRFVEYTPPVF